MAHGGEMDNSEKIDELVKESSQSKSSSTPGRASPKLEIQGLASKLARQEVQKARPDQWGLLTAISEKARKRTQGSSVVLHYAEHVLGRTVADVNCVFDSPAVSGRHCTIVRRFVTSEGRIKGAGSDIVSGDVLGTFVRDSSSNGTFINNEKLKRNGLEVRIRHGDVLSLVAHTEQENAFSYVFQEMAPDSSAATIGKRKGCSSDFEADESPGGKRVKGIGRNGKGIVAVSEGPVSLDEMRRLQKSNEELRQQQEDSLLEKEKLRGELRAAEALRLAEVKDARISITEMYSKQIEEMRVQLVSKSKDLEESSGLCVQQEASIEDLNHRLASAAQSRSDSEDTIQSLNASIGELKKRLEDEFSERQKDRAEWTASLETALEKARAEAAEELKRHTDTSARLQKQQQDMIANLQEMDKENRRLVDSMRTKVEVERQAVIQAEEKSRRLATQLQEERVSTESACKRNAELEVDLRRMSEDLQEEKEISVSAGAKVARLELAMESSMRDLTLEKQRLQGARERIVLRETQLRAFYSTAAQVEALQQKQQDQLKNMLRTLEDSDGEGEYLRSRRHANSAAAHSDLGNEARILVSLSGKQLPTPNGMDPEKGKITSGARRGIQFSTAEGREGTSSPEADRLLAKDTDRIDGDTQQEADDTLIILNPLLRSGSFAGVINRREDVQPILVQGQEEKRAASPVIDHEETQMLHDAPETGATLLITDTVQMISSSEAEVPKNTHLSDERRQSGTEMDAEKAPALPLREGDGHIPQSRGSAGDQNTPLEVGLDLDGECTGRNDTVQTDMGETAELDTWGGEIGARLTEEAHLDDRHNATRSICTQDLLTSEVAGSWAFGTQASVHSGEDVGSPWNAGSRVNGFANGPSQQLDRRNTNEGTLCTEDLLASEVAGSWALGTPASVHADNGSLSSDDTNPPLPEDGGSQVATTSRPPGGRFGELRNAVLEDVMHFADPVNSQNSLSPATTNHARSEREPSNEILGGAETGIGALRSSSRGAERQQQSDDSASVGEGRAGEEDDDSTTDGGDNNDDIEVIAVENHASDPLSHSSPMSVR